MDYTVDISHRQQLSVLLRTTDVSSRRVKVEENFVGFFCHASGTTGKEVTEMLFELLTGICISL
jgi:hypothetical protein